MFWQQRISLPCYSNHGDASSTPSNITHHILWSELRPPTMGWLAAQQQQPQEPKEEEEEEEEQQQQVNEKRKANTEVRLNLYLPIFCVHIYCMELSQWFKPVSGDSKVLVSHSVSFCVIWSVHQARKTATFQMWSNEITTETKQPWTRLVPGTIPSIKCLKDSSNTRNSLCSFLSIVDILLITCLRSGAW